MESKKRSIFEKIIAGEVSCDKVYENDKVFAFKDIAPKAPVHILIVTKKVIPNLQSVDSTDYPYVLAVIEAAQEIAKKMGLDKRGYRLLVNNGLDAGQTISHLHFHLLGGAPLGPMA